MKAGDGCGERTRQKRLGESEREGERQRKEESQSIFKFCFEPSDQYWEISDISVTAPTSASLPVSVCEDVHVTDVTMSLLIRAGTHLRARPLPVCYCIHANMFVDTPPHTQTVASIATGGQPVMASSALTDMPPSRVSDGQLIEHQRGSGARQQPHLLRGGGTSESPLDLLLGVLQGTAALINQVD